MVKFKLSNNISISSIADSDDYTVPERFQEDHFILFDQRRDKEFLINATVKYFIDKFSVPKPITEVVAEVAHDVQAEESAVAEMCSSFFKFLCDKKLLLPEDVDEPIFSASAPLLKEGDEVNGATIVEVLSERDLIDIYRAVDKSSGFEYAIKMLNRNKCKDERTYLKELAELEREYTALKSVEHIPAMCKAFEFNKGNEQFAYFTVEYIDGRSLSGYLRESELLLESDCMRLIEAILEGFSSLHKSKIIHGDIHSSNVLVLEDRRIKIIDLGLSRNLETDKSEVLNFGGVNFYMPPERINITSVKKYLKEPDLYSDVYQIGLLMYLVLYNELPFDGFIWEELATNIKETDAVFAEMSFLNYPVSPALIGIIQKCLKKIPSERYNNAGEILEDFKMLVLATNTSLSKQKEWEQS